ncbi:MAG TPA: transposase [Longimicrobiales bacterium]|nr:transposase [Longimicrobiales bacterium]
MLKALGDEGTSQEGGELALGLDELARQGAQGMIAAALDEEAEAYLGRHRGERGYALVVRTGRARGRKVTVESGTIELRAPRVHDRREGERFTSKIEERLSERSS